MKGPKKLEVEVSMEGGPMSGMADEAAMADEEMYMELAPKGKFTPKALMPLVKETNKLLPLFGQTANYPALKETLTELPTDFVRVLSMFKAAVDDAIAADAVSPDMELDFSGVKDDSGLMLLAGKLNVLGKSMEFKRFLKEPMKEEESMGQEMGSEMSEEMGMSPEEEDNMMMSRM